MRRAALFVVVFLGVFLTACGSTTRTVVTKPVTPAPASIKCPPGDVTMQCELRGQPAPVGGRLGATPSTYGIDFGWSTVSASGAKAIGARFGASYFSYDGSKNWTRASVAAYHRLGLATVGVWETSATRATERELAGASDAVAARSQAAAVGNTSRPILFAIDCDCSSSQILGYFRGVHKVLGGRDDAYGGYNQVWALAHAGLVGHENWQTYAWSGGRWLSASIAPLEQYLNGNAFDNDRALRPAYGQWPYKTRPANLEHYERYDNRVRRFGRQHARERATVQTWDRHGCRNPVRRLVCKSTRYHLRLLRGRLLGLHRHRSWRYGKPRSIGARNQQIEHRLTARKPIKSWAAGL